MRRREFITLLGVISASSLSARAQQSAIPVIGVLHGVSAVQWTVRGTILVREQVDALLTLAVLTPEPMALRAFLTSPTRSGGHVEHGVEEIIACDDFEQLAGKGGFSLAARGSPFLEQLQRSLVDLDTALIAWPPEAIQWPQAYLNQRATHLECAELAAKCLGYLSGMLPAGNHCWDACEHLSFPKIPSGVVSLRKVESSHHSDRCL